MFKLLPRYLAQPPAPSVLVDVDYGLQYPINKSTLRYMPDMHIPGRLHRIMKDKPHSICFFSIRSSIYIQYILPIWDRLPTAIYILVTACYSWSAVRTVMKLLSSSVTSVMTKFSDLKRASRTGGCTYINLPRHTSPDTSRGSTHVSEQQLIMAPQGRIMVRLIRYRMKSSRQASIDIHVSTSLDSDSVPE